jgi:preprotein translocase subunit SecG
MLEVVLVIHLILALAIIGLVLLQRSSGGGLGMGGGGGLGDFASARSTANALTKATTICALLFFVTSLSLAVIAKNSKAEKGLLEAYKTEAPAATDVPAAVPVTPEPPVPAQ